MKSQLTPQRVSNAAKFKWVLLLMALLAVLEVFNLLTQRSLTQFGNYPRLIQGLPGIALGPWVHGSLQHFFSNILPFGLFSFLLLQYGVKRYLWASGFIILSTGLLVWLFGRSAVHIGASGLIYGYFAFLLLAGFINGKPKLILISVTVGFFYGGLVFGILPSSPYISWESHLFGFISGLIAARIWAK